MSYLQAIEAAVHGWVAQLVAYNPAFEGVNLLNQIQLAIVSLIGGHLMTRGQLLPTWLRNRLRRTP